MQGTAPEFALVESVRELCKRMARLEQALKTAESYAETMKREYEAMARYNTELQTKLDAQARLAENIMADVEALNQR